MLKYLLLGLLVHERRHGYDLKALFDGLVGPTWPINIAQIYATLSKLEADGLVVCEVVPQENVPSRKVYGLTDTGRRELDDWLDRSVDEPTRVRDELVLKVLVQLRVEGSAAPARLELLRQSSASALEALEAERDAADDVERRLLVEAAICRTESELRWLDRCEELLARSPRS